MKHWLISALFAVGSLVAGMPVYALSNGFMQIGDVQGESTDPMHPGWIEIERWGWKLERDPTAASPGASKARSGPSLASVTVTKQADSTSATLFQACNTGKLYDEATLVVRKAGNTPLEYITISMKNVWIPSISTDGSGGEDRLTENVTLKFEELKVQFIPQKEENPDAPPQELSWVSSHKK